MRRYIITTLLSVFLIANPVQADLLGDCIVGYDFGNVVQQTVDLYPINPDCATACQSSCNTAFSQTSDSGSELNFDVIDRCKSFCQSGETFSSYYRTDTGTTDDYGNAITTLSGPASISGVCSQIDGKIWSRAVQSSITFSLGDSISISMSSNQYNNKIYGCGKDNINIIPLYKADTYDEWTASDVQSSWVNTYDHYCLNYLNQYTGSGQTQVMVDKLQVGNLVNVPSSCNTDNSCYAFVMDPLMVNSIYTTIPTDSNGNPTASPNFTTLAPNVPGQPFQYSDSTSSNNLGLYRRINDLVNWYNDNGGYIASEVSGTKNSSGPCRFSVLEENIIDTGLYVQNGDELSISWKGNYNVFNRAISNTSITATSPYLMTLTQKAMAARNLGISNSNPIATTANSSFTLSSIGVTTTSAVKSYISTCSASLNSNSALEVYFGSTLNLLNGENARQVPLCVPLSFVSSSSTAITTKGLSGSVKDNAKCNFGYTSQYNVDNDIAGTDCSAESSSDLANDDCYFISSMDYSQYSYAGILSGAASTRSNLSIRMSDITSAYKDNSGGVSVNIAWGGCPISDGVNTQYFISACNLDASKLDDSYPWVTFSSGTTFPQTIAIPSSAPTSTGSGFYASSDCTNNQYYVYMRVFDPYVTQIYNSNTDSFATTVTAPQSNLTNLYGSPGNRYGYYSLQLQKIPPVTTSGEYDYTVQISNNGKSGSMQKLAKFILQTIIGTQSLGYKDGILMKSYNAVTAGNSYLSAVRAMLVMYVAFLALSFIMGLSDFTQKEAVSHLLKVGLITSITSGTSWDFFGTYILPACVNGAATIAAMVSSNGFTLDDQAKLNVDPSYLISYIDQALDSIWSKTIWLKCLSLMFSSFWGVIFTLLLICALVIYTVGLLKVVIVYCFAIMGLGFLVFIAPVMIPMCLFKFTAPIFEKWWKNILSYAVQPIMLFASVCILNFLTMTTLYATFNFSVCPVCYVGIKFMGKEWCPIEIYLNNDTLHASNNVDGKIGSFLMQSSIILLMLSYIMFEMSSVFTSIAARLITGSAMAADAGKSSDQAARSMGVRTVGQALNTAGEMPNKVKNMSSNASAMMNKAASVMGKKNNKKRS